MRLAASAESTVERHIASKPELAKLTPEAVGRALEGFPLALPDFAWLSRAIQGALYASQVPDDERDDRQRNRDTQAELNRCGEKVGEAWLAVQALSQPADAAIWDYTARKNDGVGEPPEHREFKEAVEQMERVSILLRRSALMLDVQKRGWRQRAKRDERVFQARCLALVYRQAFNLEATAHTRPTKDRPEGWVRDEKHTIPPWPDFYERVIDLAFGEAVNDLPALLDEAQALDKQEGRVSIGAEILPNKPL